MNQQKGHNSNTCKVPKPIKKKILKRQITCKLCRNTGHNSRTCPSKISQNASIHNIKNPKSSKKGVPQTDVIIEHPTFVFKKKLAAFDYDHTLVKPKTKSTFSKNESDWKWLRENIPDVLKAYHKKNYSIVIFTNQSRKYKHTQIKLALDTLQIPYKAYIMYNKSLKKPNPHYFNEYISTKSIDKKKSFYVGDALGRPGDWSDSDKDFAVNCGLKYYGPEEIFPFPRAPPQPLPLIQEQEVVLMVGYPGSGKSTYAKTHFTSSNYTIISGDTYKSSQSKIIKALKNEVSKGQSVVLDATHSNVKKRAIFITIAKDLGLFIRVVLVDATIEEAMYQNQQRENPVPNIAMWMYRKYYERPTVDENIDAIIVV